MFYEKNMFVFDILVIAYILLFYRPDSKPPIPQNVSITYNINLMKVEDGPGMAGPIKDYERVLLGYVLLHFVSIVNFCSM